ncbi:MAG: phosphoribosylaminoimidazolesuccinocarboxamide synthase [Actinomycetes bacterium]
MTADGVSVPDPGPPALPGFTPLRSGKVRDLYASASGDLLLVASDRISAYDWVLPTPIPDKGRVLTALSLWWFERLADLVPTHVISATDVPQEVAGRAVLCRTLTMLPVECVARGYLAGSGLVEYREGGAVCGVPLPPGLEDGSQLPEPIFTPATKAEQGDHDENVSYEAVAAQVGEATAAELRRLTLEVYRRGAEVAGARGIVVADTKLEFGRDPGTGGLVLADEVLTPDSSRFWPGEGWRPGRAQPSYDKQFVRDWLVHESGWDRHSGEPPPPVPDDVAARTRDRYVQAYERITGLAWS